MPEMSRTFEPSPVNCGVACMRMVRCFSAKFVHLLAYGSNSTCAICCDLLVQQLKPKASVREGIPRIAYIARSNDCTAVGYYGYSCIADLD
jgi:hypothetical protein